MEFTSLQAISAHPISEKMHTKKNGHDCHAKMGGPYATATFGERKSDKKEDAPPEAEVVRIDGDRLQPSDEGAPIMPWRMMLAAVVVVMVELMLSRG